MANQGEKKEVGRRQMVAFVLLRLTDSAVLPWTAGAGFLLAVIWVLTKDLDSKDRLALLETLLILRVLPWLGWLLFFVTLVGAWWLLDKQAKLQKRDRQVLEKENAESRQRLEQMEFRLRSDEEKS